MAMSYMKMFFDYLDAMEPLGDAERGRLLTALLEYGRTGEVPQLSGNERFIFPMIRAQMDRDTAAYESEMAAFTEAKREAGRKGGLASASKRKQGQANPSNAKQGQANQAKDKDKEEDKEEDKDYKRDVFAEFAGNDLALLGALEDFEQMRKRIKAPMTERAKELLCSKLEKSCPDNPTRIAELNLSILNGWKDVYPEQKKTNVKAPLVQSNAGDAEAAMVRRLAHGL